MRVAATFLLATFLCGAPFNHHAAADESAVIDEIPIEPLDRDHWAFRTVTAPRIPKVTDHRWPQTTIDHFILAQLESRGLKPAPMADRFTLIRRLSFDLIGLPPSPQQVDAFVGDHQPGAYRRLVDRLLASPEYGHRWSQYWLDLARFAETDGFEHDKIRPTAWRYRDWVIDALNDDLPYDRFVTLQLAGDIVRPDDPQAALPTAFCLSGPDMPDINSQVERKHVLLNEVTATVGAVLLSLQMGCAQCHDHKYDMISQGDFYRLRAFFDPAVRPTSNRSVSTLDRRADPAATSRLWVRGDWRRPGPPVSAAFPRIANPGGAQVKSEIAGDRRLDLARWLTDPSNPLTARSIVNRVWQHHFGRGLSSTPSDFGVMGAEPTHPDLLDHLATELIARRWSLKELHRRIVLSAVYRTRSRRGDDGGVPSSDWRKAVDTDPDNKWLARFPRRRQDAETIRDAMLASSGVLNRQAGGPGVQPPLPQEMIRTLKSGQWKTSPRQSDHYRRSVYVFARRNLRYPLFATFDRPAANCSCAVRHSSTTPVQALSLLNSKLTLEAARRLAVAIAALPTDDWESQIVEVYRRVLSRSPDAEECLACVEFLRQQTEMLRQAGRDDPEQSALTDLCRAMFNSNQFLYVD